MKITVSHNQKTQVLDLDAASLIEDVKALIEVEVFRIKFPGNRIIFLEIARNPVYGTAFEIQERDSCG